MFWYKIIVLLSCIVYVHSNIALITGHIQPSGIINARKGTFSVFIEIEVLENYPMDPEFIVAMFFSESGFIGSTAWKSLSSSVTVNGRKYPNRIYGYDTPSGSIAGYMTLQPFTKGRAISIEINNLRYVNINPTENEIFVVLATSEQDPIVQKRVLLPFHSNSYVAFDPYINQLTTRFISSFGFQKSAYLVFKYPTCVHIPADLVCSSITWLLPSRWRSLDFTCSFEDNAVIIRDVNAHLSEAKAMVIKFTLDLEGNHTCKGSDYVNVFIKENNGDRITEKGVLEMGIYSLGSKDSIGLILLIMLILMMI